MATEVARVLIFLLLMNLAAGMAVVAGFAAAAAFGRDVGIGAGIFTLAFLHTGIALAYFASQAPAPAEE
jgi:hypothetical protein